MVELRAEDVKEALEKYDGHMAKTAYATAEDMAVLAAAARAWLASQEQTPDYDRATKTTEELLQGAYAWDIMPDLLARAIVDAALVGFHPQPTEGDER